MSRRRTRRLDVWPGYVDALSALLMVLIFLVMIFSVAQFFMSRTLSEQDSELTDLSQQIRDISNLLDLSDTENAELKAVLDMLSAENSELQRAQDQLIRERDEQTSKITVMQANLANLMALNQTADARTRALESELASETARATAAELQIAALGAQIKLLREQLEAIGQALAMAEQKQEDSALELKDMARRLNLALATQVNRLAEYRSEFFGRLKNALKDDENISVVGDRFVFSSEVLFAPGSANLGRAGRAQLAQLAVSLNAVAKKIPDDIDWVLRVDGHTDSTPIRSRKFPDNWALSTARALNVVRYLQSAGVAPTRMAGTGFGEYQPLATGHSARALARNRRIEFKLTSK